MTEPPLHEACEFALDVAERAARISRKVIGRPHFERKADNSPVTETDRRIQRMILDAIAARFPAHACLGEEHLDDAPKLPTPGEAEFCWVVDPLDGTRNFTHGFPTICTSIALMRGDHPLVGVVYEHAGGWHCSAIAGEGTRCNGRDTLVSQQPPGSDTLIAVPSGRNQPILPTIQTWFQKYVLRNVGSTALHMAYVASGAVDAAVCYECKLWDIAAGTLLIREAGGRVTDWTGQPRSTPDPKDHVGEDLPFFAAAPAVFDQLLSEMTS